MTSLQSHRIMKARLFILLLLLGCSLKATPLPPPPVKTAGGQISTQMSFTNSNHDVITVTNRISTTPDIARLAAQNPAVDTNSPAISATETAVQAPSNLKRIWLFGAFIALPLCLLLVILSKK